MQQCRRSCVSTVARCESAVDHVTALSIMWQRCWSCDSAFNHATVALLMWQHCRHDATALSWCDSAVDHVTVLSIMWQCCQSCDSTVVDVTTLSMACDSTVNHAVTWLTALSRDCQQSHAQQLYCAIDNKVIQRTVFN
jgi:hypothetical protein